MSGSIYLLKQSSLIFDGVRTTRNGKCASATALLTTDRIYPRNSEDASLKLCTLLRSWVASPKPDFRNSPNLIVKFEEVPHRPGISGRLAVKMKIYGPALREILSQVKWPTAVFHVSLSGLSYWPSTDLCWRFHNSEIEMCSVDIVPNVNNLEGTVLLEHTFFKLPSAVWNKALFSEEISTNLEIEILLSTEVNDSSSNQFCNDGMDIIRCSRPVKSEVESLMESLWQETICTDFLIIAANGSEYTCHKELLTSHSPVFEAMLQNENFQEGKYNVLRLRDMSEIGVKSLLAYLYHSDLNEPEQDFEIAMELLEASEKYSIDPLKMEITRILMWNQENWRDAEKAFRLFCFTSGLEDCTELKNVAARVMQRYKHDLVYSEDYRNLFKKSPSIAMDLCNSLL